jgi:hypothetical protein
LPLLPARGGLDNPGRFLGKLIRQPPDGSTTLRRQSIETYGSAAGFSCLDIGPEETAMPAKSKAQQKAAGAALSAKRGDAKVGNLKGAARSMYKSMDEKQLHDLAATKRKGKPEHSAKS